MILWINGAFGSGKTTTAYALSKRLSGSFVFDPENAGYYLRKNEPFCLQKPNFQDELLWRKINFEMLLHISRTFEGTLIVPMTLVQPEYYLELIDALRKSGVKVFHCVLGAEKETLIKRLHSRFETSHSWAAQQIDPCLKAFQNPLFENQIATDLLSIDEIVTQIGLLADVELLPPEPNKWKAWLCRKINLLKHIKS